MVRTLERRGVAIILTMQRGTIQPRGRHWVLRFWEYQIRNGVRVRVNVHKKPAPIGPAYPDKKSVEPLAWKELEPINTRLQTPESATPITEFIETVYLPMAKQFLRSSTYKDYKRDAYEKHFKHRLGSLRLRDFRPAHGQRLLSAIANPPPNLATRLFCASRVSSVARSVMHEPKATSRNRILCEL